MLPAVSAAWLAAFALGTAAPSDVDRARLPAPPRRPVSFARDVYPILEGHCFACHSGPDARSGVRLDVRAELLRRGLVRLGKGGDSRLVHAVSGLLPPGESMPPPGKGKRLSAEQVGLLRAWVDQGLAWDETLLPPPEGAKSHWSFRPLRRPALPAVKDHHWPRTAVDPFILAALEARRLRPAPEADRRTLIRRVTLDLTGLPPTPDEVAAFVDDPRPGAYERLVDRLLASPAYGERWGRHWLDVARYAESDGYEQNLYRPHAWRYRDWVIAAFNADLPYDRFVRQQLAGDEAVPLTDEERIATGFLGAARYCSNEEDKAVQRNDVLVDVTNAVAAAFLGLTVGCAQCHDHKFDPISQKDYYRLHGFFVRGQVVNVLLEDPTLWAEYQAKRPVGYDDLAAARTDFLAAARARLGAKAKGKSDGEVIKALPAAEQKRYEVLRRQYEALRKRLPDRPQTIGFYSPATTGAAIEVLPLKGDFALPYRPDELRRARPRLLLRGDPNRPGPVLTPGWPAFLGPTTAATRSALAAWLVSPDNPLTARVWANRIWHYHLGRGLCATPGDVGLRGARPTHPELLDWLACELRDGGWGARRLHRLIVLSATYRQAARPAADDALYARWKPRRLEAEALRDAILFVAGELDRTAGGPGVALIEKSAYGGEPAEEAGPPFRRTVYLRHRRQVAAPFAEAFDGPTANEACSTRHVSTVALQPLFLLNSPFMAGRARALARRLDAAAEADGRITTGFHLVLGRDPLPRERAALRELVAGRDGSVRLAQVLLSLNEFAYLH